MLKRKTPKRRLSCSFCSQTEQTVSKLIGGPGVHICNNCVDLCNQVLAGEATPAWSTPDELSDEKLLAALRPTAAAVQSMQKLLHDRVSILRKRGVTWETIGEALGISRQAAWERFSP
jgi:hypothetical protein